MSLASKSVSSLVFKRAEMLKKTRLFFENRNVLEVDTPILSSFAPIDANIDILEIKEEKGKSYYLHSSPEYAMKKLLAEGAPDIYQLSHVFRKSETSKRHRVEFTMLEWYRINMSLEDLMQETKEYISLFIGDTKTVVLTYTEVFEKTFDFDPFTAPISLIKEIAKEHGFFGRDYEKETYLDFLFEIAEQSFNKDTLTFLIGFPAEMAYLAKTTHVEGKEIALRFEAYYGGYELANAFDELKDPTEQKKRFENQLKKRVSMGKNLFEIDEEFLQALTNLPECTGVAVGFDRLMMLYLEKDHIGDVTYLSL